MATEPSVPSESGEAGDRRRATRYVAPLLALGLLNLFFLLRWGLDPLWAFAVLPPMLFLSGIGWTAFRHGFHDRPAGPGRTR
ncbi:hypothetical protein [Natrinema marinum]|uniref:hypothetical protein n=1 Tax=Natrinema marinum TaxID=2961598 RepID=UPI0020C92992|nr:hypothetical protein [Natrinema marinum]